MALSERSRSALYRGLSTIVEEEAVGEMLSSFPVHDADELVTKEFVRAEIAEVRTELHTEVNRILMWSVGANAALMSLALVLTRFG